SYDLKFKDNEYWPDSAIGGFPALPEFSICIWFNLDGAKPKQRNLGPMKILDYVNSADIIKSFPIFYIESSINEGDTQGYISFMSERRGASLYFDKGNKWHHFCLTRNSITGETTLFLDGENKLTDVYSEGLTPSSEGRMRIGGFARTNFEGKISGLNIWNRVLSDEEVHKMAQSCDDSSGSFKDWYDIKSELTMKKYILHEPSRCMA
ncbi:pentraxin-related protein PTX3-like, partial [Actinia tenebrosa]|uniref:Pentraxin-related protein PTX3-like n=1 Tax=Actinia tenebrosa TaxID=6105 RepID=A0A6P8I3C2_ACTTE